jgi:hypothetical protein
MNQHCQKSKVVEILMMNLMNKTWLRPFFKNTAFSLALNNVTGLTEYS